MLVNRETLAQAFRSKCGRRIGRLIDTLRLLELPQSGLDITLTIRLGDTRRAPNSNRRGWWAIQE